MDLQYILVAFPLYTYSVLSHRPAFDSHPYTVGFFTWSLYVRGNGHLAAS